MLQIFPSLTVQYHPSPPLLSDAAKEKNETAFDLAPEDIILWRVLAIFYIHTVS